MSRGYGKKQLHSGVMMGALPGRSCSLKHAPGLAREGFVWGCITHPCSERVIAARAAAVSGAAGALWRDGVLLGFDGAALPRAVAHLALAVIAHSYPASAGRA